MGTLADILHARQIARLSYTSEGKDTPRVKWKILLRTTDKNDALELALGLDEHGQSEKTA